MKYRIEGLTEKLLNRNIKPSYQRIRILEYLDNHRIHPTVDRIFIDLQKEIPTLSKTTIYNTLNIFMDAGLVRVITIEDNETRYDIDTSDHGHFKCDECGEIYDFQINIEDIKPIGLSNFKITDKSVYFRGVCESCLNKH
ncbi:MAG: transcriptional repressor [Clostridiaceae bacterium]|nr:transcriptional repressor [Clostridiaceae bacterium]